MSDPSLSQHQSPALPPSVSTLRTSWRSSLGIRAQPSKSIRSLGVELGILCNILEKVRAMAEGCTPHAPVLQSHVLVQILEGMKVYFEDHSEILGAHTSTPSDSALRQGWKQVRWVFRESEVADLRRSIEAYKSSLLLTLTFAKQYETPDDPSQIYLLMMA